METLNNLLYKMVVLDQSFGPLCCVVTFVFILKFNPLVAALLFLAESELIHDCYQINR